MVVTMRTMYVFVGNFLVAGAAFERLTQRILRRLDLSAAQAADLAAFLRSLSR